MLVRLRCSSQLLSPFTAVKSKTTGLGGLLIYCGRTVNVFSILQVVTNQLCTYSSYKDSKLLWGLGGRDAFLLSDCDVLQAMHDNGSV